MNDAFGVTYEQLQPKLFLFAGPSATKHGPNTSLFKGLDRTKIDKINELIDALNDKNRLLEKQEDILYEEHDKFVEAQNSLALEVKRNEMLSCELSTCHDYF
jgi:hypothetical protein